MDIRNIRTMRNKVESLQERIARLRAAMEGGCRQLRLMPGGGVTDDKLAADMAKLDEMERELVAEVADMEAAILAAEQVLESLPEQQQRIMRLRYIRGLSWRKVAKESHYSVSHCKYLHSYAMNNLN